MSYRRDGDMIVIELTDDQHKLLIYALGIAAGANTARPIFAQITDLADAVNEGNPNWRPYNMTRNAEPAP